MKKFIILLMGIAMTMFLANPCMAASAKFAAQVDNFVFTDGYSGAATLSVNVHVPSKKDLLIGVSLQTGIYTQTKVKGSKGVPVTESASGTIHVDVELWEGGVKVGNAAPAGGVTFDHRYQQLDAVLGGVLEGALDTGTWTLDPETGACVETLFNEDCEPGSEGMTSCPDGEITIPCELTFTDEEINLILKTMGAHHFNFIAANLDSGTYEVRVVVTGETASDEDPSGETSEAKVGVGPGSLTVEVVKATNNPDGIIIE